VLIGVALLAAAQLPMSVGEFLAKADGLQHKGMLAMFSSDLGLLKAQARQDLNAFADALVAAEHAHRPLPACPPKEGNNFKFTIDSSELLQYYRSIPVQQRSMSSKDAFAAFMARKFPCGG
jgi:hypothetical protein